MNCLVWLLRDNMKACVVISCFPESFLPPAYEIRRKVIFILRNVCLSTLTGRGGGGTPVLLQGGGVAVPGWQSYKILYFWNCPVKSYIFSNCPINPIFSTKTSVFVNSFKHFQGLVNKDYEVILLLTKIFQNLVFEINLPISCWRPYSKNNKLYLFLL